MGLKRLSNWLRNLAPRVVVVVVVVFVVVALCGIACDWLGGGAFGIGECLLIATLAARFDVCMILSRSIRIKLAFVSCLLFLLVRPSLSHRISSPWGRIKNWIYLQIVIEESLVGGTGGTDGRGGGGGG